MWPYLYNDSMLIRYSNYVLLIMSDLFIEIIFLNLLSFGDTFDHLQKYGFCLSSFSLGLRPWCNLA